MISIVLVLSCTNMPHANSTKLNLPQMQCNALRLLFLSIRRRPALNPVRLFFSVHHYRKSCHHMHGHSTCPKKRTCGTTYSRSGPTPESTLRRYLTPCVCRLLLFLHLQIARVHHTLCEHLASSAAQVEAVEDEIFDPSSSSSLFLPLTTDREILTKKMQTINPQPADTAP
jgi:hypothetical protein